MTPRHLPRLAFPALVGCALLLVAAAACAPVPAPAVPAPAAIIVTDVPLDTNVYRVTVRWRGSRAPGDLEERLLERCAEVTARAGAHYFFIVNATAPIANTAWLKEGSVAAPTFVVPGGEGSPGSGTLLAVIRVFRRERAPEGYPLYDAARVLHDRREGTAPRSSA